MTLFSAPDQPYSHRTRIVLARRASRSTSSTWCPDATRGPARPESYHSLPTLVDRDLVLYDSRVIIEYLDERFRTRR